MFKVNRYFKLLDSRLRGNDDMNVFNFIYYNRPSENAVSIKPNRFQTTFPLSSSSDQPASSNFRCCASYLALSDQ